MPGQEIIGPNYLSIKKELPIGSSFFINSPQGDTEGKVEKYSNFSSAPIYADTP